MSLKKGDIVELKEGHKVYASLEERFLSGFNDSDKLRETDIEIGRIYYQTVPLQKEDEGYIENYLEKEYAKQFEPGYIGARGIVGSQYKTVDSFNTSVFAGKYVVLYTTFEGGGTQGTPSGTENYPSGHKVYCKQIIDGEASGREVSFYESGCFTAMIKSIKPVGKVNIKYILEDVKI